jgi:hypothetical protein
MSANQSTFIPNTVTASVAIKAIAKAVANESLLLEFKNLFDRLDRIRVFGRFVGT